MSDNLISLTYPQTIESRWRCPCMLGGIHSLSISRGKPFLADRIDRTILS
jgi:hypothetical protein